MRSRPENPVPGRASRRGTWPGRVGLLGLAALFGLSACDDGGGNFVGTPGGDAAITVQLTDMPARGDVSRAWLEITSIELQGTGGGVVLDNESTGLIEVSALVDSVETLVADDTIPPGQYGQLRLFIGGAVIETDDGQVFTREGAEHPEGLATTGDLRCPSCSRSGLKVNMPGGSLSIEGETAIVMLDFDVTRSFGKQAGMSGRWVMRPVITTSRVGTAGSIAGTVVLGEDAEGNPITIPECGGEMRSVTDFVPLAIAMNDDPEDDTENVRSGQVREDGSYRIGFVAPGTFDMSFADSVAFETDTLVFEATADPAQTVVEARATSIVDYTIDAASCVAGGGA